MFRLDVVCAGVASSREKSCTLFVTRCRKSSLPAQCYLHSPSRPALWRGLWPCLLAREKHVVAAIALFAALPGSPVCFGLASPRAVLNPRREAVHFPCLLRMFRLELPLEPLQRPGYWCCCKLHGMGAILMGAVNAPKQSDGVIRWFIQPRVFPTKEDLVSRIYLF